MANTTLPRGIRNKNPGNIRFVKTNDWTGKIPYSQNTDAGKEFEQFTEMYWGVRAKMVLIYNKVSSGTNTIAKLIADYAPPSENNTGSYINQVVAMTGIDKNAVIELTEDSLIALSKAISIVENGASFASYVTDADYKKAISVLERPLKKKAKPTH